MIETSAFFGKENVFDNAFVIFKLLHEERFDSIKIVTRIGRLHLNNGSEFYSVEAADFGFAFYKEITAAVIYAGEETEYCFADGFYKRLIPLPDLAALDLDIAVDYLEVIIVIADDLVVCDLGYVIGGRHYDDEQPDEERLQTRKFIDRAMAHMLKFALEGISNPIDSYTNLDY